MVKVGIRLLAAGVLVAVGLTIAAPGLLAPTADPFIPSDIGQSALLACWIGGEADGSTSAYIMVGYSKQRAVPDFRALLARRQGALVAIHDCLEWWKGVEGALKQVAKEEKR